MLGYPPLHYHGPWAIKIIHWVTWTAAGPRGLEGSIKVMKLKGSPRSGGTAQGQGCQRSTVWLTLELVWLPSHLIHWDTSLYLDSNAQPIREWASVTFTEILGGHRGFMCPIEWGFPTPRPQTCISLWPDTGYTAGGEQWASKRNFICVCSHSPSASITSQLHLRSLCIWFSQENRALCQKVGYHYLRPKGLRTTDLE